MQARLTPSMAHPVPNEGDIVEVEHSGTTERGTVVEGRGHWAEVDIGGEDTVRAWHVDHPRDGYAAYRHVEEEPDEPEDEADDGPGGVPLDPRDHTVPELKEAIEDASREAIEEALEIEQGREDPRVTAVEALEGALDGA